MEYKALTQSTIKISKEVTINNAIDFSLAGMPRLGAIKSYCSNTSNSTGTISEPQWANIKPKALIPAIYRSTITAINCCSKAELTVNSSYADSMKLYSTYSSNASKITAGVLIDYSDPANYYPNLYPGEMSSVELDGKTYYGYKNAYYIVNNHQYFYQPSYNEGGSYYYYIPFKGKVTVVIYKAASKTIDTIERIFNSINDVCSSSNREYIFRYRASNSTSTYIGYTCLVVPKETDDLVLGIFVEDVK